MTSHFASSFVVSDVSASAMAEKAMALAAVRAIVESKMDLSVIMVSPKFV